MKYIPSGKKEFEDMLKGLGIKSFDELITHIPEQMRDRDLQIEEGISEFELMKKAKLIAGKNKNTANNISFMGCGIYDHYIPPAVRHIALRPEFYTAYTPYQAEVSQGTLQVIYEFQSMICELYDMDISNASMYDGASSTAEACHMAIGIQKKKSILLSDMLHPSIKAVIGTYLKGMDIQYDTVSSINGLTDILDLKNKLTDNTAAFVIQTPNFLGCLEDMAGIAEIVKNSSAMLIVNQNPMSLGLLKPPGFYDADIAVGEAQTLGIQQAFGGPLIGVFTAKKQYARSMPGRIIGKTVDIKNREGYVMTLQTREQHIRREKATSNICTNEGLCLLMSTVYMELLGREGFYTVSRDSAAAAHYLQTSMNGISGIEMIYNNEFYNEFPVKIKNLNTVYEDMKKLGYLMGVKMHQFGDKYKDVILLAATEKRSRQEIDKFIMDLKGVCK